MISLTKKRDQKGFTIVELLIVIVVIGILAALVVTTYSGIQAKARDSKRKTDLQALQTQIEAYYAENNAYPSNTNINTVSWRNTNMKSLNVEAMKDPSSSAATPTLKNDATIVVADKQYGYAPTTDANGACEGATDTCTKYTLTAYLEGTKATITKNNLD